MASDHVVDMREEVPVRKAMDLITTGQLAPPVQQLGEEDKVHLAESGIPFIVEEISYLEGDEYGLYWQFRVKVNGEGATFRLSQHEGRDAFIQRVQEALVDGPIGGLRLNGRKTQKGKFFAYLDVAE